MPRPGGEFGNASAVEPRARTACARDASNRRAREVAALVGASPEQIVWTSGATEANNLAFLGVARFNRDRPSSSSRRAPSTRPCSMRAGSSSAKAVDVTYLKPDADGIVEPQQVAAALRQTRCSCR